MVRNFILLIQANLITLRIGMITNKNPPNLNRTISTQFNPPFSKLISTNPLFVYFSWYNCITSTIRQIIVFGYLLFSMPIAYSCSCSYLLTIFLLLMFNFCFHNDFDSHITLRFPSAIAYLFWPIYYNFLHSL